MKIINSGYINQQNQLIIFLDDREVALNVPNLDLVNQQQRDPISFEKFMDSTNQTDVLDIISQDEQIETQKEFKEGYKVKYRKEDWEIVSKGARFATIKNLKSGAVKIVTDEDLMDQGRTAERLENERKEKMPFSINQGGQWEGKFVYRNQLFLISFSSDEITKVQNLKEEVFLRLKKHVLLSDEKIQRLKKEVEALERVLGEEEKVKRTAIPENVKLIVYKRDEGKCVKCGSAKDLQFDHVIPVSKGGSSTEENVQILCQTCNLKKSDDIMF